jgi:broad specificity phosphatase PhoE
MFPPDQPLPSQGLKNKKAVVVVRHGERLDYVMKDRGLNWIPSTTRPWDPPLTDNGKAQAKALGTELPTMLSKLDLPPISNVYSSPFYRCRQTAAGLCESSASLKVKVELGLSESINQNWFRSWALEGTDGTWGFGKSEIPDANDLEPKTLHPLSQQPVQPLLNWKDGPTNEELEPKMDKNYESKSSITEKYSLRPPIFENHKIQQRRMHETLNLLIASDNNTIVLVSHGGPVTHLFESLTGKKWNVHGTSRYCCYSIYEKEEENWNPLVVNQVLGEEMFFNETEESNDAFTWA